MDSKKIRIIFILGLFFSNAIYSKTIADAEDLMKLNEYKQSIEVLDEIISANPEYAIAYNYRGYARMMSMQYDEAYSDYKKSNDISSTPDSQLGMQWALLGIGKYEESIDIGYKILEKDPLNYYAKYRVADAYLEQKDYKKAYENYKVLEIQNGKNADLIWKIGLCEYYSGNKKEASRLFKEGIKLYPEHNGLQYSLANTNSYPQMNIIPEFSSYNFRGSDFIGSGQKAGIGLSYSPNETWNFRGNITNDKTQNLNATKGISNYIVDPLNLAYLVQYNYINPPSLIPSYYLNQPINAYNLAQLYSSKNYVTNKYSLGLSYNLSEKLAIHFTPQMLESNTSLLNGATAIQAGLSYSNKYAINISLSNIQTFSNKGGQLSASIYYPFLKKFYSSSTATGQTMTVKSSETIYFSYFPLVTTTGTVYNQRQYGFFQQEVGYRNGEYTFSIGGRNGTARTPFLGENWIYTGFDLLNGGYAQIGYKVENLTVQLQYSQDRWLDSRNEKPISDSIKIMLIWRL